MNITITAAEAFAIKAAAPRRRDRKAERFRAWLDEIGAEAHRVPHGAFNESGTQVATRIVVAVKTAGAVSFSPA